MKTKNNNKTIATINNLVIKNGDNLNELAKTFGYFNFQDMVETKYEIEELFDFVCEHDEISVAEGFISREFRNEYEACPTSECHAYLIESKEINEELASFNINYLIVEELENFCSLDYEFFGFEDIESAQKRLNELEQSRFSDLEYIESILPKQVSLYTTGFPGNQRQAQLVWCEVQLGNKPLEDWESYSDIESIKEFVDKIQEQVDFELSDEQISKNDDEEQVWRTWRHLRTLKFDDKAAQELNEHRIQVLRARLDELED